MKCEGRVNYLILKLFETMLIFLSNLCAWGNDAASEVLIETCLLLVENNFQAPSSASLRHWPSRIPRKGGQSPKRKNEKKRKKNYLSSIFYMVKGFYYLYTMYSLRTPLLYILGVDFNDAIVIEIPKRSTDRTLTVWGGPTFLKFLIHVDVTLMWEDDKIFVKHF